MAGPWEQYATEAAEPTAKGPWDAFKEPKKTTVGDVAKGLGEAALALGTGALAAPAGGIAGTLAAATPFLRKGIGADISERIGRSGTYEPRTDVGQKIVSTIATPFEWLAGKADVAGESVSRATGSPLLGTGVNTAIQSAPMMLSKIGAKASKAGLADDATRRGTAQVSRQLVDEAATKAKEAGFVLPPAQVNPGAINNVLQGLAGEGKLSKALSVKNQPLANNMIREAFGLDKDTPLSLDALSEVRRAAGANYDAIRDIGMITADEGYANALKAITADAEVLAKNFPKRGQPPILAEARALAVPEFDSKAAIPIIRDLRETGDKFYRTGDKKLGGDYKKMADEMENLIERNLVEKGAPAELIDNFRNARKTIAQTYTVQKHLASDGNVNVTGLAKELKRKPLEGNIKTVAEFGENFPKAAQRPENIAGIGSISMPWAGASAVASAVTSDPRMLAIMAAPPAIRSVLASKMYQNALVNPPSYSPNALNIISKFAANEPAQQLINVGSMAQEQRR